MKVVQRQEARRLRKQGFSLNEIVTRIGCAKSSISRWTRDIPLTITQIHNLRKKGEQGLLRGRIAASTHPNAPKQVWSKKREKAREQGKSEIGSQNEEGMKVLIAALYWGEGKKARNSFCISNTDPTMIRLIVSFLRANCEVPENRFRFWIHLHPHLDVIRAQEYWATVVNVPIQKISVTKSVSSASQGKRNTCPFGTFNVCFHDTLFRARVEGWMDALKDQKPG